MTEIIVCAELSSAYHRVIIVVNLRKLCDPIVYMHRNLAAKHEKEKTEIAERHIKHLFFGISSCERTDGRAIIENRIANFNFLFSRSF